METNKFDNASEALGKIANCLDIRNPTQALALAELFLGLTPAQAGVIAEVLIDYANDQTLDDVKHICINGIEH